MSDSSSEDENADRLKEAVWSFGSQNAKVNGKDGDSNDRQSRRTDVSKHQHDGNELGTTPEFQSHVAKKLGALLDRCISEVSETDNSEPDKSENRDQDKEGFRLFSTSAPGNWMEEPPPPPKRRPIPSSSDSDSDIEMRFREAAVSGSDILASAAQHLKEKTEEKSVTKDSVTGEEDTIIKTKRKKKKKKKKKKKIKESTEGSEENIIHVSEKQSNERETEDQTAVVENLTKKKKKRIKLEED